MNLEAINKWLDEEYGCSYTKLEELHDFYFEKYCNLQQENKQLKECYCNRTDCSGRIKNSMEYDSLYQKYNKQLDNWNKLKEFMKKEYDYLDKYSTPAYGCAMGEINRIKNKMQEMEKSDSNE